jgi:hypothetical protein
VVQALLVAVCPKREREPEQFDGRYIGNEENKMNGTLVQNS